MAGIPPKPQNNKPGAKPAQLQRQGSVPNLQRQGSAGKLPNLGKMQQAFGNHDVGGVRVHTGGAAVQASAAMGAQAFTGGGNPQLRKQPSSNKLTAHEAAHVVQQKGGAKPK